MLRLKFYGVAGCAKCGDVRFFWRDHQALKKSTHLKTTSAFRRALFMLGFCLIGSAGCLSVAAQGTAFTYQGRLNSGANAVTGSFDFRFTLFNTNATGSAVAGPVTNRATSVTNGLFLAMIDFGADVFAGGNGWLELAVRTNGSGSFTLLAPRQPLTPSPYAIYAANAGRALTAATATTAATANSVLAANIAGTVLNNVPATNVTGYDLLGRVTSYFNPPYTTNFHCFSAYTVTQVPPYGFNGTYVHWPQGSTATDNVFTNGSTNFLYVFSVIGSTASPDSTLSHTYPDFFETHAVFYNNIYGDSLVADPTITPWLEWDYIGSNIVTTVTPAAATVIQSIVTNYAATTILTNVALADLGNEVGALRFLSNNISGERYAPVFVTNASVSIQWLGDSFAAGYLAATDFTKIVNAYATRIAADAGHPPPQIVNGIFSGYPAYFFSTNAGVGFYRTVIANETGINDLRYGLTNWGATPDISLINSQSNMIQRAAIAGSKLFILFTLADWCSYTQYTNLVSVPQLLSPNIPYTTNNNGFSYQQFQAFCQNVRRWQLAQITNTAIPVLVIDLKSLPLDQCLADGLHPNTQGQVLIGKLAVWALGNGWCPQAYVPLGVFTNCTLPSGVTLYITNGIIGRIQ